jgi:hypothetical protein
VQPSRYAVRNRAPHVIVNTTVRFRLEKRTIILLDDDGKEYKGQLEREAAVDARTDREKTLEAAKLGADIEKALAAARQRHPDFGEYEQRMDQISKNLRPAAGMTPDEYIEMLYAKAKATGK